MFAFNVALRYLRSKKSSAAVNIISYVSIAGIALAVIAMVVVMSVFNGFARFTSSNFASLSAPITIAPSVGKVIPQADSLALVISSVDGVDSAWPELSEKALAIAGDNQGPVTVTGISPHSPLLTRLHSMSIDGSPDLQPLIGGYEYQPAIASIGAANLLLTAAYSGPVNIYEPRRVGRINPANPAAAFRVDSIVFTSVVSTGVDNFDSDRILIPLHAARNLLNYTDEASSIAVYPHDGINIASLQQQLADTLRDAPVEILTVDRESRSALKMINIEKWVTFMMLTFILVIAAFNIVTTMAMMIADKQNNIEIMRSLGATRRSIGLTFACLSLLITLIGILAGLFLGALLTLSQQFFGWLKMSADPSTLAINTYPVELHILDLGIIALVALAVGFIAAAIAATAAAARSRRFLN